MSSVREQNRFTYLRRPSAPAYARRDGRRGGHRRRARARARDRPRARRARAGGPPHRRRPGAAAAAAAEIGGAAWGSELDVRDAEACRRPRAGSRRARRLARRLGQQRRHPRHRATLGARRGAAPDRARGQRARHVQRHARRARADAPRRPRPRDQRHLAGRARSPPPGEALYAATKHARDRVHASARSPTCAAPAQGIHISAVCPDGIWTPMLPTSSTTPTPRLVLRALCMRAEDGRRRRSSGCSTARAPCSRSRAGAATFVRFFDISRGWRSGCCRS